VQRGELALPDDWAGFVTAFSARYGFAPLWLERDELDLVGRPRLRIVLDRTEHYMRFVPRPLSPDRLQVRAIRRILERTGVPFGGVDHSPSGVREQPDVSTLLIVFADFEQAAVEQAHAAVTADETAAFERSLRLGGRLWQTARAFGPPVVFVRTEAQAAALRDSSERERWADLWYAAARRHDEFARLHRTAIHIEVDSKEHLDAAYAGSLFHCFR